MNNYTVALIYIAFFALIGITVYFTNSATPLWALLLTLSINVKNSK